MSLEKNRNENPSADDSRDFKTLFEESFSDLDFKESKKQVNKDQNTPLFDANSDDDFSQNQPGKESSVQSSNPLSTFQSPQEIATNNEDLSPKSSLRIKYEAEVRVIQKSLGTLEDIRRKLGLSKRKMAQLLMVDPSAWTRWTQTDGDAPPHIYRSLQWYLILQDKHPELKSSFWLNSVSQPSLSQHEIENIKKSIAQDLTQEFKNQLRAQKTKKTSSQFEPIHVFDHLGLHRVAILLLLTLIFVLIFN